MIKFKSYSRTEFISKILGILKNEKVLDLGCRDGVLKKNLKGDFKYNGIDLNPVKKDINIYNHDLQNGLPKNLENIEFDTGDESGTIKEDILNSFEYLTEDIETDLTDDISEIVARKNLMDSYQEAKKTFIQYYTQKYSGLQNLTETKIIQTTDIFSLTMDKYTDITRVDEVIANNDIVDPLFIKGTLEILER